MGSLSYETSRQRGCQAVRASITRILFRRVGKGDPPKQILYSGWD
jgi:hypothetical protein